MCECQLINVLTQIKYTQRALLDKQKWMDAAAGVPFDVQITLRVWTANGSASLSLTDWAAAVARATSCTKRNAASTAAFAL